MSGSTIGGVVGAAVGFWIGGPQGAQWGWMIGSAIGGYVDPTQIEGPRLKDARTQTSRDGVAIPFGWGTYPTAGNIIWQADVVEHKTTEQQGKGGPEVTEYTYTRSYAIGICEGPITGLLQIKRNGKLVYDARDEDTLEAEFLRSGSSTGFANLDAYIASRRAEAARFFNRAVLYTGDETQLPDPTIEAYLGVGNVPAYRGLAYIVLTDDDVTDLQGAIAQYEFVVATDGVVTDEGNGGLFAGRLAEFADTDFPLVDEADCYEYTGYLGTQSSGGGDLTMVYSDVSAQAVIDYFANFDYSTRGGGSRNPSQYLGYSATTQTITDGSIGLDVAVFGDQLGVSNAVAQPSVVGSTAVVLIYNDHAPDETRSSVAFGSGTYCAIDPGHYVQDKRGTVATLFTDVPGGQWSLMDACGHPTDRLYGTYPLCIRVTPKRVAPRATEGTPIPDAPGYVLDSEGNIVASMGYTEVAGTYKVLSQPVTTTTSSRVVYTHYEYGPALASTDPNYSVQAYWDAEYAAAVAAGDLPAGRAYDNGTGGDSTTYPQIVSSVFQGEALQWDEITESSVLLSTIVADLCERDGLTSDEYDVSQLTDLVPGFRVANEGDAASAIAPLQAAYQFDVGEWDGKVRFIKRGGTSSFAINGDDLVERDGDAFERERVQEAELLRRVTVGYIDPLAAYGPTTQKWERRVGTVQAKGEASAELPLTLEADEAATIAKRRGLIAWGEPEKQKFSLPYRLAALTPTDIGTYTDEDGEVHTLRLMQIEDDSGIRYLESSTNAAEAYGATATGVSPVGPTITDSVLIGPTNLVVMDLPLWRSSDADDVGLYVAAAGHLGGWLGAQIDVSADEGVSYTQATQTTTSATIGYTTTALTAWASSEAAEEQEVTVYLPFAPSSVDYATLLRYNNRAAVQLDSGAWEILQYQTVTALGDDLYTLSGLVRGRYNTTPGAIAADATFVLLDSAVQFVRLERDYMGQTLTVRATSFGTSSDAAVPVEYDVAASPASQTEWAPHYVTGTRDGSDIVTTCIGRARLGTETSPYQSSHFTGYQVKFTDGVETVTIDVPDPGAGETITLTYTAAEQTAIFGGTGPLAVSWAAINDITGVGPFSESITA